MLMPSLFFKDSLLDDFFDVPSPRFTHAANAVPTGVMHTDVREMDGCYELDMNLPGFKKDEVTAELKDGYLTVSAATSADNETKDDKGKYIRRERYSGSCSRSFYVGEGITKEDIRAKFEDGVLKLSVPKREALPQREEKHYIAIEG